MLLALLGDPLQRCAAPAIEVIGLAVKRLEFNRCPEISRLDLQSAASIEDQLHICHRLAEREGWTVVATFADHAQSGATLLRPGFQGLMSRLSRGDVQIVMAEGLDRFSRDQEPIAAFYKQATFAGARVFTLAEGDVSELHIGLKGTMGALYLKDLTAKTRRGIEGRIRAGLSTNTPPYGYRVVRKLTEAGEVARGLREIDPDKAAIVVRIFREFARGSSAWRIAHQLNEERISGPSGGLWYDATIRGRPLRGDGLLRNPNYAGQMVWSRRRSAKDPVTGKNVRRYNDAEAVVTHEAPICALSSQRFGTVCNSGWLPSPRYAARLERGLQASSGTGVPRATCYLAR